MLLSIKTKLKLNKNQATIMSRQVLDLSSSLTLDKWRLKVDLIVFCYTKNYILVTGNKK